MVTSRYKDIMVRELDPDDPNNWTPIIDRMDYTHDVCLVLWVSEHWGVAIVFTPRGRAGCVRLDNIVAL